MHNEYLFLLQTHKNRTGGGAVHFSVRALLEGKRFHVGGDLGNGGGKELYKMKIYPTDFKDVCPHCHQPQSWAVSGLRSKLFENPIVALCVGGFFGLIAVLGHYFTDMDYLTLEVAFGIIGIGGAAALVLLIWNLIQLGIKTKKTSSAQKNLPDINWAAVQNLLDEP